MRLWSFINLLEKRVFSLPILTDPNFGPDSRLRYLLSHLANGVRSTFRSMLQTSLTIYSLFLTEINNNFCNRRHFKGFYGDLGGRAPQQPAAGAAPKTDEKTPPSKSEICSEGGSFWRMTVMLKIRNTYACAVLLIKWLEFSLKCENNNFPQKIFISWKFSNFLKSDWKQYRNSLRPFRVVFQTTFEKSQK